VRRNPRRRPRPAHPTVDLLDWDGATIGDIAGEVQFVGHDQRPHRRLQAVGADHHLTVVGESVPAGDRHLATSPADTHN
jgi:hypothetical protein